MSSEGCMPTSRRNMSRKSHSSLHGSNVTSSLHFSRIPVQMSLAMLCPKYAKSAAQSIPNHPPKPGVSRSLYPNAEYRQLESRNIPHSHILSNRRYNHTEPNFSFFSVMFLCISQKSHAVHRLESKEQRQLAFSYNIGIVMVAQAQELPCIPSVAQGLTNFFHRQNHPADEASENCFGRNHRANTTKCERRATLPSKLRGGRRPVPPGSLQQPRPVSFSCVLPRLSFGEALPDVDELFSSISGSSGQPPLPPDQTDRGADTRGQRTQADEYREECVSQHPMEHASMESSPPRSFVQPPPHQAQDTALLETCIREMLATPERPERGRGRARNTRVFDEPRTQPIPLIAEGSYSHGGYSLFPSRQRTGNASTPPALIPRPEPEHPQAEARLDSAALSASETHQAENPEAKARLDSTELPESVINRVSTLDPLKEEFNRDSAAHVHGDPASVTNSLCQSNARAAPVNDPTSHDTSAIKDISPSVLDQPAIPSSPSSTNSSRPASHTLPPAKSLRTSRTLRCRPTTANRPHNSKTPGIVAAADSSPSGGDGSAIVDGPSSSSGTLAKLSPSPPPVSPCDLAGG